MCSRADNRPHFGIQLHPVFHLQIFCPLGKLRDYPVANIPNQNRHGNRHTTLASRAIGRTNQSVYGLVHIRIWHHHHMVLCPAKGLNPFAVFRPLGIDIMGNRGRADERNRRNRLIFQNRIYRFLVALNDTEHAFRQASFCQQFCHHQGYSRVSWARLQDKTITCRDRQREHPHRHHHRKVKRRNARYNAQRLTKGEIINACRGLR